MNEPKRWMDEGPPEAIEHLLHAASAERPPEASMARTLSALGLGAGATSAAATAGAATAGAAGAVSAGKATGMLASGALLKWGLVGGALLAASVGGTMAVKRVAAHGDTASVQVTVRTPLATSPGRVNTARDRANASLGGVNPSPNADGTSPDGGNASPNADGTSPDGANPSPNAAETSPNGAASSRAPNGALTVSDGVATALPTIKSRKALLHVDAAPATSEPAPVDAERLAEEVALVDRARSALAQGDARGTIVALDDYDARFSRRKFAPEALYLRMEALLRLGQTSAARSVAEHLASAYPSSPNAARARQVAMPSNP